MSEAHLFTDMTDPIERIAEAERRRLKATTDLGMAVRLARKVHGASWADVGQALDITRQAAQQRFAFYCGDEDDDADQPYSAAP